MSTHRCVIPNCKAFGEHWDDCDDNRCRGCKPRACDGHVCTSHRVWLEALLGEIPGLWAQLNEELDPVDRTGWTVRQLRPVPTTDPDRKPPWIWVEELGEDKLAKVLPMGIVPSQVSGNRAKVSGSKQPAVPTNLDKLDLAGGARLGSRGPHARGVLGDDDQIGHLAVATELDVWVRDWRDTLYPGHSLPVPTVPVMVDWLAKRLHDACDQHPAIDEFATDVRDLRSTIRGVLGLTDAPKERCHGIACRSCDNLTLFRDNGLVSCAYCGLHYSEQEYRDWTGLLAAQARRVAA